MNEKWKESELLRRLMNSEYSGALTPLVVVGIGDDAAVLSYPFDSLVLCTDSLSEGVHFNRQYYSDQDIGHKLVAVNLSDLAAMGARPLFVTTTITAPPDVDVASILTGIDQGAKLYAAAVVGGDLCMGQSCVVSVTAVGTMDGNNPMTRSGAREGDEIYLTGPLGASASGMRSLKHRQLRPEVPSGLELSHLRPTPRLLEGALAARLGASACIDISDGLALDLHRLADASGVGFQLDSLPIADGASYIDGVSGGEDYELLFCASKDIELQRHFSIHGLPEPFKIGVISSDPTKRTLAGEALDALGYLHG